MKTTSLILLVISLLSAQTKEKMIDVKGTGTYKTIPDLGILTVEISAVKPNVNDAVKDVTGKADRLTAQLQTVGFKKQEIQTTNFTVEKNLVWENNQQVDKGYVARQNIIVEFPQSKEKIGAIVGSFSESENDLRFIFSFTLSEQKMKIVQEELMKRAVRDAQSRAEVLSTSAGQKLGTINHISYGHDPERSPMNKGGAAFSDISARLQNSPGFEVKEMIFSDEVVIRWILQ